MSGSAEIFGDFVLLRKLGEGAVGDVYLARRQGVPLSEAEPVVIKRLKPEHQEAGEVVSRFKHEATLAKMVNSPHVARVFESGEVDDTLYLALEYVPGWPLSRLVNEAGRVGLELTTDAIVIIVQGILSGLDHLHRVKHPETDEVMGVVHRDIAPKNIMVSPEGRVCLIDLGLGRSPLRDGKTRAGVIMGSPGYMGPEQIQGKKVDARVDLYATGVILWEMLSSKRWVGGATAVDRLLAQLERRFEPPSDFDTKSTPALDNVCAGALSPHPDGRYPDARSMAEALATAYTPKRDNALLQLVMDLAQEEMEAETTRVTQMVQKIPEPQVTKVTAGVQNLTAPQVTGSDSYSAEDAVAANTTYGTPGGYQQAAPLMDPAMHGGHPPDTFSRLPPTGLPKAQLILLVSVLVAMAFVAGAAFNRMRTPTVEPVAEVAVRAQPQVQASAQIQVRPRTEAIPVEKAPAEAEPAPARRRTRVKRSPPPARKAPPTPVKPEVDDGKRVARMLAVVNTILSDKALPPKLKDEAKAVRLMLRLEADAFRKTGTTSDQLPEVMRRVAKLKKAAAS